MDFCDCDEFMVERDFAGPSLDTLKRMSEPEDSSVSLPCKRQRVDDPSDKSALARSWVFTIQLDEHGDESSWIPPTWNEDKMAYLIYQRERAPTTGKPHYQGFVHFKKQCRRQQAQQLLGHENFYCSVARGTAEQNRQYCSKFVTADLDTCSEFGKMPTQGQRTDIEEAMKLAADSRSLRPVMEQYPSVYLKYHTGLEKYLAFSYEPEKFTDVVLRDWQQELMDTLLQPPHPRHINFVIDEHGGQGKSFFASYLAANHRAYLTGPARADRIYHTYADQTIVCIDLPRSYHTEYAQHIYTVAESLKSGIIPAGMFGSLPRLRRKPIHVIIFMNRMPDMQELSADRYAIMTL